MWLLRLAPPAHQRRRHGIGIDHALWGGERLGLFYLETGAAQRGGKVIYDRSHSSFSTIEPGMVDWPGVFADAGWFRLMPTGGVDATEENVTAWIRAGASCLGMGSRLIAGDAVRRGEYAKITTSVEQVLGWIRAARLS